MYQLLPIICQNFGVGWQTLKNFFKIGSQFDLTLSLTSCHQSNIVQMAHANKNKTKSAGLYHNNKIFIHLPWQSLYIII